MDLSNDEILEAESKTEVEIMKLMSADYLKHLNELLPEAITEVFEYNGLELEPDQLMFYTANYKRFVLCFLSIAKELCSKLNTKYPTLGKFSVEFPFNTGDIAYGYDTLSFSVTLREATRGK